MSCGAVVYAKHLKQLCAFYAEAMGLKAVHAQNDHVVLESPAMQLVIVAMPERIAASIPMASPAQRREDAPIKLAFAVASIGAVRAATARLGGELDAAEREWLFQGHRVCDGRDPEGNVFQVREPAVEAIAQGPLARWHQTVASRDGTGLAGLLADNVIFHSPVVHTPQVGKAITTQYLAAALRVFGNPSFRYLRELSAERDAVLEFEVEIDGIHVNGVDMIRWDDAGRIVEFKVMLRPLKAVHLIQQKMAALLQERKP